jgi:hypothetical protein
MKQRLDPQGPPVSGCINRAVADLHRDRCLVLHALEHLAERAGADATGRCRRFDAGRLLLLLHFRHAAPNLQFLGAPAAPGFDPGKQVGVVLLREQQPGLVKVRRQSAQLVEQRRLVHARVGKQQKAWQITKV